MVLKRHKIFRDGRESIDDEKRPERPTEFSYAMIDDIRHAIQEGVHIRSLFSSLRTPRAQERFNLSLSFKVVCIFIWISQTAPKFPFYGDHTVFLYGKEK